MSKKTAKQRAPELTDAQLDAMLPAALGQIDYDIWKELRRTRAAMREALQECL